MIAYSYVQEVGASNLVAITQQQDEAASGIGCIPRYYIASTSYYLLLNHYGHYQYLNLKLLV